MTQLKEPIKVLPEELVFSNLKPNQPHSKFFQITNTSSQPHELSIESSNQERYTIDPSFCAILPGQSRSIEVTAVIDNLTLSRGKEIFDEVRITSNTFEYKLDIRILAQKGEESPSFPKQNKREFTLGSGEDVEKELTYFKSKCLEAEQENYILAGKVKEFETKVESLMKEKWEKERIAKDFEKAIHEKDNIIRDLERTIERERSEKEILRKELEQTKSLENYFDKMKTLLRQTNPELETVVDIALKQERIQIEKKNQQILSMFQLKDDAIYDLEQKVQEMETDYQKVVEMLEDQRVLVHNSEEGLKKEQRESKNLKEALKNQNEHVVDLERELQRLNTTLGGDSSIRKQTREEDHDNLENYNEKLIKEIEQLRRESNKNQEGSLHMAKENDYLRQQLNEYVAREEFIKELYNRQQESKDDRQKLLIEKEQTIRNLENKLQEQNQQLEEVLADLGREQETRRTERSKIIEDHEIKLKELLEENEDLKRIIEDLQEQIQEQTERRGQHFEHGSPYSDIQGEDLKSPYELSTNDHKKQIADLKKQVNQLTDSVHDIQHSLDREKKEKGDLITSHNIQLSEMVNQLEELRSSRSNPIHEEFASNKGNRRIYELEEQVKRNREELGQLERKLKASEDEKIKYVEEIEILSQRIELQGKSVDEFQNESLISRLNSRISVLKLKEQKLYEENSKLETLYNELRSEYENAKIDWDAERNEMMQALDAKEGRDAGYKGASIASRLEASGFKASQDKLRESELISSSGQEGLRREIQILKSIKTNLENEILLAVNKEKFLQNNIEMLTNERNEYKERAGYLRDQLNQLEDQLRERDRGSKEEIFTMRKQILDMQSELKMLEDNKQQLERELDERRTLEDRMRMTERLKEKVEHDLVNHRADYEGRIDELVDQLRTMQRLNEEFKLKISDQDLDYNTVSNTLAEKESLINKLTNEKAVLEGKATRLQNELDDLRRVNDKIASQMTQLRTEFNTVKDETNEELKRRDHAEKEYKNRIISLEERLEEAVREKERLRMELNNEVERLSKTHQETINLLRDDNRELERRYFDELSEKRRDNDMANTKERDFVSEINHLKREVMQLADENNLMRIRRTTESGKKETKRKKSARKSSRAFNSDTEEDPSMTASRDMDRFKLYEIDIKTKNAKIIELKEQISELERENMKIIKENEKIARVFEEQRRELDQQRREILTLDHEKKYVENNDAKMTDELRELKIYLSELKTERDRINWEMKYSEENMKNDQRRLEHLIQIVRECEEKQAVTERTYKEKIGELEQELAEIGTNNQRFSKDYEQAKALITLREKEIFKKDRDLEELNSKLNVEQEENEDLKRRVIALEEAVIRETDRCIAVQNDFREETEKAGETLTILKEEMIEQNKKYEETIGIYEKQIAITKEKFINDIKELQTKINVYFNQTESFKKSLSVAQEKKNLEKLFEKYADNITQVAQRDATIGSLKDRIKTLMTDAKNAKTDNQKLKETVDKLTADLEAVQKKFKTQTIPKMRTKVSSSGTTAKATNFMELNKENYDENEQDFSKKTSFKEVIALEAQLLTARGENKKLVEEVRQLQELNVNFQHEIDSLVRSEEILQSEVKRLTKESNEQQKNYKTEINKMLAEVENVKSKWHSPEVYEKVLQDLQESESALKQVKEEMNRKKEYIQTLKTVKDSKVGEESSVKKENEQLKEELEKLKKQIKEISRKDSSFKDFREKYETLKQSEKALQDEKNSTQEKMKGLKVEIARKESAIKDLKDKIDLLNIQNDTRKLSEEELEKSREVIRKLKGELERKDQALKSLKAKLDNALYELDNVKTETLSKGQNTALEVDREIRKHDQTRGQLKNIEAQYQNVIFLLRRLYRDTFSIVQKLKTKTQKSFTKEEFGKIDELKKFSDSLNILNLTPDEIQLFVNPGSNQQTIGTDMSFGQQQQIEKFEKELNSNLGLNATMLYDMLSSIIEERVNLEKKVN